MEDIDLNNEKMIEELIQQKNKMNAIIRAAEKRLQTAPEGRVRIIKHGKGYQYFLKTETSDMSGKYIPVANRKLAIDLIQKRYDYQITKAAQKQAAVIDRFLKDYDPDILKRIYEGLSAARKENLIPAELSDHEYVEKWKSVEYYHKDFADGTPEHYTSSGERVRSKSEVMIADALKHAGVPYRYECSLDLVNRTIYPDFTILRINDREQLYWEHLGMMDDVDYCNNAIQRIRGYEASGIFPGINLILTMETSFLPINLSVINKMINTYCI